jgi:type VI secretion system protein ImpE
MDAARNNLDSAEEERPAISGRLNDQEFHDVRDYDDFVGPVLELIVKDKYVWLPFEQIRSLQISPPRNLRDMIWASARVQALDGTIGEVYVPTLYANTNETDNDQARLGRVTDSRQLSATLYRTIGLRLFLIDGEEKTLFDVTKLDLIAPEKLSSEQTQAAQS